MKGGLESVQGLEEVNLADVRRIVLEDGAFSGEHLKRVHGNDNIVHYTRNFLLSSALKTVSASPEITGLQRGSFRNLHLERLHLEGNVFIGNVSGHAFTNITVTSMR